MLSRRDSQTYFIHGCCCAHVCMIFQKYALRGFSIDTAAQRQTNTQTGQSVNAYSLLAAATRLASKSFRPEPPAVEMVIAAVQHESFPFLLAKAVPVPSMMSHTVAQNALNRCWHGLPCPTKHPRHCPMKIKNMKRNLRLTSRLVVNSMHQNAFAPYSI